METRLPFPGTFSDTTDSVPLGRDFLLNGNRLAVADEAGFEEVEIALPVFSRGGEITGRGGVGLGCLAVDRQGGVGWQTDTGWSRASL